MATEKRLICDPKTGDSYYHIRHASGLDIFVMEMPGFTGSYAAFGTHYGSVHTDFISPSGEKARDPMGIAHFLEHKLFENEECDAYELYAETGANANAYTSFDKTVYLFECTDNFNDSLKILLESVTSPYFTDRSVEKEQGIIAQEILMCEDNPFRRVYFNLLKAAYHTHPVREEIAGTVGSISHIDKDTLYRAHEAFYDLSNMILCCSGNCNIDSIIAVADEVLKPAKNTAPKLVNCDEPRGVYQKRITEKMAVGLPMFAIGYKADPDEGVELCRKEYISAFLLDMIFGQTSRFYKENTENGLINSRFETETNSGDGFLINIISGESKDPDRVLELMNLEIGRIKREGLDQGEFDALKKTAYGSAIRGFNNVAACSSVMLESHMRGYDAYEPSRIIASITLDEVLSSIDDLLDTERTCISVITGE